MILSPSNVRDRCPTLRNVTDEHIRAVAGTGLNSHAEVPGLTGALAARGYDRDSVAAILGGNFVRVFRTVCP